MVAAAATIALSLISSFFAPHLNQLVKEVFDKLTENTKDKLTKLQTMMLPRLELMIQTEQMTDNDNNRLSQLLKEFVDVAYEIEDVVDKDEYKDLKKQSKGKVWKWVSSVNPRLFSKWKMSNTLTKLEEKVSSIYDFYQRLPQRAPNGRDATSITNLSDTQLQPAEGFLGRDTDIESIVRNLIGTAMPNNLKVVVIVGVGGVGKTELAKSIYNLINVRHKKWLSFSRGKFDEVEMTRCMAGLGEDGGLISKALEVAGNMLRTNVFRKKFLLVLDGIWYDEELGLFENRERWSRLCAPLQKCARGSMILITTRMQIVAKSFSRVSGELTCHLLEGLEHQHCLAIFNKQAFGDAGPDQRALNANLPMIASEIITKIINNLEGIPLAATEAGEKLRNKYCLEVWNGIKSNIIQEDTEKSLMWSYKMLPCHLQQCIRHFTLYPQGFKFNHNFLVLSWIAAGVITHQQRSQNDLERLGRKFFDALVDRSFLQEKEDGLFVLHPALHAFLDIITKGECIRIAGNERQEIPSTIKHLSIEVNSLDRYENEISKLDKLRTLFLNCNNANSCSVQGGYHAVLERILKNMKRLRVLRIACCSINKLPDSVGRSKHLRFLDLSNSSFNQLPESVCRIYLLWYLNLSNCNLNTVPKYLKKLIKLQYLVFNGPTRSLIPHIDRLTLLRELKEFHVKNERGQLNGMDNLLGTLRIINLEAVGDATDADEAMLNRETPLKEFVSEWSMPETADAILLPEQVLDILQPHDDITSLTVRGYTGNRPPDWMINQNSKLEALHLDNCPNWGTLPALGNIYTYLKKLVLSGCCIDDATLALCLNNLTSLSCLKLSTCSHITSLPSVEVFGTLVKLKVLQVMDCQLLTSLGGILALPFLQEFNISLCPALLAVIQPNDRGINLQGHAVGAVAVLPKSLLDLKITDCGISDNYLSSCLMGLNKLISLELHQCASVTTLPLEEVMRHLTSLECVNIHSCVNLQSVGGLQVLAPTDGSGPLRRLSIQNYGRLQRPLHDNLERLMQAN